VVSEPKIQDKGKESHPGDSAFNLGGKNVGEGGRDVAETRDKAKAEPLT
jgi:hypothetical protein